MMTDQPLAPAVETIRTHIGHITRRWNELGTPCRLEVVHLTADDKARVADVQRYTPTPEGLDEAAKHIAAMNAHRRNSYIVVNPVRDATAKAGHRANATDILGAFFHWADADDAQAADNIRAFVGPKATFHVLTGTQPSLRPHVYWELEEPTLNLAAWQETQKAIAATLKTDSSVIDPPRIMRVAGTINWPKPSKAGKGYVAEVTRLRFYDEEERPPVSSERMARAFANARPAPSAPTGFVIATAESGEGRSVDHYADILRRAQTDGEKHTGVRDLAASLAGQGINRALAEAIVRTSCPVWDEGVENLLDTAYAKFYAPADAPQVNFDYAPAAEDDESGWRLQSLSDFTADFVAPEYIIEGVVQRGRLYTLTAPTGSGKTAVMLHVATCLSRGYPVCGRETEPCGVIYLAGENPDDVRARIIATLEEEGVEESECNLHFIAGTFNIRQDMRNLFAAIEKVSNVGMIVIDTLAAYFDGDDSNSNAQMLDFARVIRTLTTAAGRPGVIMPAHPVKNAARNNLTPMGGSALLNEVDGNLCIWKRETAIEMHWQGKHRGAEFDPLAFELVPVTSEKVKDRKGRLMPTVMARPLMEMRALDIASAAQSKTERLLLNIRDYDGQSMRQRCVEIGMVSSAGKANVTGLHRMVGELLEVRYIKKVLNNYYLTEKGEKAVDIIENGGSPPEDLT